MPIRCLNCYEEFEELAEYKRHNAGHAIDEGMTAAKTFRRTPTLRGLRK